MDKKDSVVESVFMGRDAIFGQEDTIITKVDLPEPYKGHVFMKSMDGNAWDSYQESILIKADDGTRSVELKKSKAKLLIHCICDESGNMLFSEADVDMLSAKSNKFLEVLTKKAQSLNGMGEDKAKN